MRRAAAPLLLLALLAGGCHRAARQADTLDAGADARARTAAKALEDIAAAEQASAKPLPQSAAAPVPRAVERADASEEKSDTPEADERDGHGVE